jgi:hypothetical protein
VPSQGGLIGATGPSTREDGFLAPHEQVRTLLGRAYYPIEIEETGPPPLEAPKPERGRGRHLAQKPKSAPKPKQIPRRAITPWLVFAGSLGVFSAVAAIYWNAGLAGLGDARIYMRLAQHPGHFTTAPWGFRVLTPYLVWLIPTKPVYGFAAVTIVSLAAACTFLYSYLREYYGQGASMFGVALFLVSPAALIELKNPVDVDALFFAMVALAFLALARRKWLLLAFALAAGTFDKETMLFMVFPLIVVGIAEDRFKPLWRWAAVVALPISAFWLIHYTTLLFSPVPSSYNYFSVTNISFVFHEQHQLGGAAFSFLWAMIDTFGVLWIAATVLIVKAPRQVRHTAIFILPVLASVLFADNWARMLALAFMVVIPLVCAAGLSRPIASALLFLSYDAIVSLGLNNFVGHPAYRLDDFLIIVAGGSAVVFVVGAFFSRAPRDVTSEEPLGVFADAAPGLFLLTPTPVQTAPNGVSRSVAAVRTVGPRLATTTTNSLASTAIPLFEPTHEHIEAEPPPRIEPYPPRRLTTLESLTAPPVERRRPGRVADASTPAASPTRPRSPEAPRPVPRITEPPVPTPVPRVEPPVPTPVPRVEPPVPTPVPTALRPPAPLWPPEPLLPRVQLPGPEAPIRHEMPRMDPPRKPEEISVVGETVELVRGLVHHFAERRSAEQDVRQDESGGAHAGPIQWLRDLRDPLSLRIGDRDAGATADQAVDAHSGPSLESTIEAAREVHAPMAPVAPALFLPGADVAPQPVAHIASLPHRNGRPAPPSPLPAPPRSASITPMPSKSPDKPATAGEVGRVQPIFEMRSHTRSRRNRSKAVVHLEIAQGLFAEVQLLAASAASTIDDEIEEIRAASL